MTEQIKKSISNVTINYEDGTHDKLQYYSLVGFDGEAWYSVLYSPPKMDAQIKMNNMMVDLANKLLKSH